MVPYNRRKIDLTGAASGAVDELVEQEPERAPFFGAETAPLQ